MKIFADLQRANGVNPGSSSGFHEYPVCYSVIDEECHETLLLEDMKEKGFQMLDYRKEEITIEHAILVFSALGKYHALSFALRDKNPQKFKEICENVPDVLFDDSNEPVKQYFETFKPLIYGTVKEDEKDLRKKLENIYEPSVFQPTRKCVDGSFAEPFSVICHGDCWTNNILFKYDENHIPIDVNLLDWQASRYASPVADILYFLFCCTSQELRRKHYHSLIKLYHTTLSETLEKYVSKLLSH